MCTSTYENKTTNDNKTPNESKRRRNKKCENEKHQKEDDSNGGKKPNKCISQTVDDETIAISTTKIKIYIRRIYEDSPDEVLATKIMIYKTINCKGYFIENIEENENPGLITATIRAMKVASDAVKNNIEATGIDIQQIIDETIFINAEGKAEFLSQFNDRKNTLQLEDAKYIKQYTWSERNYRRELEEINKWESYEVAQFSIPTKIASNGIIDTYEKYYIMCKKMLHLPTKVNYSIIENTEEINTITILIKGSQKSTFINDLITNNIPFRIMEDVELTNNIIDEYIYAILNSKAIQRTFNAPPIPKHHEEIYIEFC